MNHPMKWNDVDIEEEVLNERLNKTLNDIKNAPNYNKLGVIIDSYRSAGANEECMTVLHEIKRQAFKLGAQWDKWMKKGLI